MQKKKSARSSIGQHFRVKHSSAPKDLSNTFSILKKCKSKFDCLVFEMCFINELRPSLNVQSDSLRAKVFKLDSIVVFLFCILYFILLSFFIVLNIFLHLTHIYANSINFFTYLKMTEDRSKRSFLSVPFQGDILVKQRIFISDYFIDRYISNGNNGT